MSDPPSQTAIDGGTEPEPTTHSAEAGLDPSLVEVILESATGAMPPTEFTPHPSFVALLNPAAQVAAHILVLHGKRCQNKKACRDTPPPLRNYLSMREGVLAQQLIPITRALIQFPQYTLTRDVRDSWLAAVEAQDGRDESESPLLKLIESGEIFTGAGLSTYLAGDASVGAQRLGTTLWARGFPNDRDFELFRLLAPVAVGERSEAGAADDVPEPDAEPRRDRKAHQAERQTIKKLESELKELKRDRRRSGEDLAKERQARHTAKEALVPAEAERERLSLELTQLQREARLTQGRAEMAEKEKARSIAATAGLRENLTSVVAARGELEQERNRVVRELSLKNRQLESLRAQMATTPTGTDAVHAFLEAEEARIKEALMILQGGDRLRAEEEHAAHRKLERAFRSAYQSYIPPRPVVRVEPAELSFEALGGADEVGRSSYLLNIGGYLILVDCGIKIGRKHLEDIAPALSRVSRLDAVLLTHAHTDHLGWLPAVVHAFPEISIYCTLETSELAPVMLEDSYGHHLVNMQRLRRENEHAGNPVSIVDPFERDDMLDVEFRLIGCEFGEAVTLPSSEIQVRFFPAGHILGAASVLIEGAGRRVLMSGDISSEAQFTVDAADWSACDQELDLLVLESTYGDARRDPLTHAQEELVGFLSQAMKQGGSAILPCFGLGRGQEVAMLLANAMRSGDLPPATVWIDGMIRSINRVYRDYQPKFLLPNNFIEVGAAYERLDVVAQAHREPVLIVTTSGMLAGGPAVEYAQKLLPNVKNRIAFTGYQDEGNPGHELLRLTEQGTGIRTVTIPNEEGTPTEIRAAAPAKKFGLSAHADQAGLLDYAARVRARNIVLVHGFDRTQRPLRALLIEAEPGREVILGSVHSVQIP